MADFDAVLRKTIYGLPDPTPELRQKVYQKARATVAAKLAAVTPPPPAAAIERQKKALEDAIDGLEAEFLPAVPAEDEDGADELENIFARLGAESRADVPPAPTSFAPPTAPAKTETVKPAPSWLSTGPETRQEPKPAPIVTEASRTEPKGAAGAAGLGEPSPEPHGSSLFSHDQPIDRDPDDGDSDDFAQDSERGSRGGLVRLAAAAVVFVLLAGAGYGIWLNRDAFGSMLGLGSTDVAETETTPAAETASDLTVEDAEEAAPAEQEQAALPDDAEEPAAADPPAQPPAPAPDTAANEPAAAAPDRTPKFTQRLNADGSEIDEGPAGGAPSVGEGTTIAAVTSPPREDQAAPTEQAEPGETPAQEAQAAPGAAVAVGQRAIFYEERTSAAQGSAESGSIVWSVVQESPGADAPPEPAIRAEASIPGKDLQLRMTIRRNSDDTLPASHIIEMIFLTPENFAGGGIDNVLRMTMKETEQATGNPLIGIPAKIADGFFLIALSDGSAETEANTTLLRRQTWIDIPVVYRSGRRALITMEKGVPGERVFDEVMRAWQNASAG